jgi:hypothetical protein
MEYPIGRRESCSERLQIGECRGEVDGAAIRGSGAPSGVLLEFGWGSTHIRKYIFEVGI